MDLVSAKHACRAVLSGAALLILAVPLAHGQLRLFHGPPPSDCSHAPCPAPQPPAPCPAPAPPATAPTAPSITPREGVRPPEEVSPPPAEAAFPPEAGVAAPSTFALASNNMLGDQLGLPPMGFGPPGKPGFPPAPGQAPAGSILVPSIRSFKISENEDPRPQDRAYLGFNFYNDVNDAVNSRLGSDIHHIRVYRETFGLEKTFVDGGASVGLRLPLNTLTAESAIPGLGGSSTDVGDLTVILKGLLWYDRQTGNLVSGGLAVTTPTGPDSFANFTRINNFHDTTLQPYVGYRWARGDLFVHGFSAFDVPTDSNDVTLMYNDIGLGYYFSRDSRAVTAVVPTFEVHVTTPLNHRGAFNFSDPAGTADLVDLTTGVTLHLWRRATLAVAVVTPVTGPRPFDFEVLTQLNVRFGASRRSQSLAGNVLGY
jgi:hypothetical protein